MPVGWIADPTGLDVKDGLRNDGAPLAESSLAVLVHSDGEQLYEVRASADAEASCWHCESSIRALACISRIRTILVIIDASKHSSKHRTSLRSPQLLISNKLGLKIEVASLQIIVYCLDLLV